MVALLAAITLPVAVVVMLLAAVINVVAVLVATILPGVVAVMLLAAVINVVAVLAATKATRTAPKNNPSSAN